MTVRQSRAGRDVVAALSGRWPDRAPTIAGTWRLAPGGAMVLMATALAFGSAAYLTASWEPPAWIGWGGLAGAAVIAGVGILAMRAAWARIIAGCLLCFCLGFVAAQTRAQTLATPMLTAPLTNAVVTGWVARIDPPSQARQADRRRYVVRVSAISGVPREHTPRFVRISAPAALAHLGDRVRWRARLQAPPGPPVTGAYDARRRFYFAGWGGSGRVHEALAPPADLRLAPADALARQVALARAHVAARLERSGGAVSGAIVAALVTGWRGDIRAEHAEALRASGLGHILAISGLHMALAAGGAFGLAAGVLAVWERQARRRDMRRAAAMIALIIATAYLVFSGAAVSTQRAYVMAGAAFVAILLRRQALSMHTLAAAAMVVLALRPESAVEPGFHMSFAAAGGLIAAYAAVRRRQHAHGAGFKSSGWGRRLLIGFSGTVITSVVAGGITGPVAALHFNRAAWLAIPVNIVAMPIFSVVVMPACGFAGLLAPFGLEAPFARIAGWGLEVILTIAQWAEAQAGAQSIIPSGAPMVLGLLLASIAALCAFERGGVRLALGVTLLTGVLWGASPTPLAWVGRDGRVLVFPEHGGALAAPAFRGDYSREMTARRFGVVPASLTPLEAAAACDALGCVATRSGGRWRAEPWRIAVSHDPRSRAADCVRADILIHPIARNGPQAAQHLNAEGDCAALEVRPHPQATQTIWASRHGPVVRRPPAGRPWSAPGADRAAADGP